MYQEVGAGIYGHSGELADFRSFDNREQAISWAVTECARADQDWPSDAPHTCSIR